MTEDIFAHACYGGGEIDFFQSVAAFESIILDRRQTFRKHELFQGGALFKGYVADLRDAGRDRDAFQLAAVIKRIGGDLRQRSRQLNAAERIAFHKHVAAEGLNAVRDHDLPKRMAVLKDGAVHRMKTVRQRDAAEIAAAVEQSGPQLFDPFFNDGGAELLAELSVAVVVAGIPEIEVVNRTGPADGEIPLVVQHEDGRFAADADGVRGGFFRGNEAAGQDRFQPFCFLFLALRHLCDPEPQLGVLVGQFQGLAI